jgi:AraC-like DNA-binding protein
VTARFALRAPWGLASAGVSGAMIRMARGAPYWLQLQGMQPLQVQAGDLVMLPLGAAHSLYSEPGVPLTPFGELVAPHVVGTQDEEPLVLRHGGADQGPPDTDMYSAMLWFSAYCRHSVFRMLPPLIHIRAGGPPLAGGLAATMQALVTETLDRRPGWRLSAARMGELLLINILREHLAGPAALSEGGLRGLTHPAIARAIRGMHHAPQQAWSVQALAQEAGMSRSRFSDTFKSLVGDTPMGYLTTHRMALAAGQLEAGQLAVAQIAAQAGYESDKVFARAFRRWSGQTPAAYVRSQAQQRALSGSAG